MPFGVPICFFLFHEFVCLNSHSPDMYTAAVYLFEWHLQNHVAICNIPQLINQVKRHVDSCHADSGAELFHLCGKYLG